MGLMVSYRHAWRRDLSSGLGLPFPRMMACCLCNLEREFDCFREGSCQLWRTSRSSYVCLLPLFPCYQQMLISRQNRTGNRFIHLPSPSDIMSLAGNCISCADLFCDISPRLTSCRWLGTAFHMQVLFFAAAIARKKGPAYEMQFPATRWTPRSESIW